MSDLIFTTPVFKQVLWGGNRMKTEYNYDIPGDDTGECWAISAHRNGDGIVSEGEFKGLHLSELYKKHPDLFGDNIGQPDKEFPLLVKIIDAKADLSIQVHPDDFYANQNENGSLGKTECWYILDCDEDAEIIVGHNAGSKEELRKMIYENRWNELITPRKIKKGDFFQIEPGTVHAIKKGTLILETQQSSDVTYRLYDYGRLQNGKPRELHLEKSIDVITCPHKETAFNGEKTVIEGAFIETMVKCKFYEVQKLTVNGTAHFDDAGNYKLFSVISGEGSINDRSLKKGDHFIMPLGFGSYIMSGTMSIITSNVVK